MDDVPAIYCQHFLLSVLSPDEISTAQSVRLEHIAHEFLFSTAYDKWHQGGLLATRDYLEKFLLSSKHLSQTYSQPINSAFGSPYSVSSSSSNQTPAPQRSKPPSLQASSPQPKSNDASFTPHTSYSRPRQTLISMGLRPLTHSPCIFTGSLIEGEPPLYLGLYVDDFVSISASTKVESKFETVFGYKIKTTFNGPVTHFLGITFTTERRSVSISLSQLPFVESLLQNHGLDSDAVNPTPSPFKSGLPIDSIPDINYPPEAQSRLTANFQHLVGCFQWLTVSTCPDLATVTNLLSKYLANPSRGHLEHCRHVLKYIKSTKSLGITFNSSANSSLAAFIHSPVASNVVALADANWGAEDQSISHVDPIPNSLPLFKSRSLSGHLVWLCGPVHWVSKRQTITARSTAEAEIYATDECTKNILHIRHLLDDLHLLDTYAPAATILHNDIAACVQ